MLVSRRVFPRVSTHLNEYPFIKSKHPGDSVSTAPKSAPYTVPASWLRSTKTPSQSTQPSLPSFTVMLTALSESTCRCLNLSFTARCSIAHASRPRLRSPDGTAAALPCACSAAGGGVSAAGASPPAGDSMADGAARRGAARRGAARRRNHQEATAGFARPTPAAQEARPGRWVGAVHGARRALTVGGWQGQNPPTL